MIKQEKLLYKTDSYSSFNNLILGLEQKYFAKNAFVYKEKKEELNVTYSQLAKDVAFVLKGFEKNKRACFLCFISLYHTNVTK